MIPNYGHFRPTANGSADTAYALSQLNPAVHLSSALGAVSHRDFSALCITNLCAFLTVLLQFHEAVVRYRQVSKLFLARIGTWTLGFDEVELIARLLTSNNQCFKLIILVLRSMFDNCIFLPMCCIMHPWPYRQHTYIHKILLK